MLPHGFNTEELFLMTKVEKGNDLNKFCKLEGMDYDQLASEAHGVKSQPGKGRYVRLFSVYHNRAR